MYHSKEIEKVVNKMKKLPTYNKLPSQVIVNEPSTIGFIENLSDEDRKKYHLDISIEDLSKGKCTPEGKLIKTIGMSRKDLPKQLY